MDRRRPRKPPVRPLVLVVDSHEDTRQLYTLALPPLGFDVIPAADVADAYTQAWGSRPDLIVTEVAMRDPDGWQLVHDLKRNPRTHDIPVVVVTSDGQPPVRERAAREGCVGFFAKPCLPDDLAIALRQLLMTHAADESGLHHHLGIEWRLTD